MLIWGEGMPQVCRPVKRLLVNQLHTGIGGLFELTLDIVRFEGDVMDSTSRIFFEEFGDWAFRVRRLQKFQVNVSDDEKGGANFLRRNFLAILAFQSQRFFIGRHGLIQRAEPRFRDGQFC